MNVVAFNGSARKDGNTAILVNTVFSELEKEGIETEQVQLAGKSVRGCIACMKCFETKNQRCVMKENEAINDCIQKMVAADGIILASPTYFANVSTELKALIDVAGMVGLANDYLYKRKAGAGIVAVRRGGAIHAFDAINHFFFIEQMIVPGSSYWNIGYGLDKGDVEKDEEGLLTMKVLGQNMAWLMGKIKG